MEFQIKKFISNNQLGAVKRELTTGRWDNIKR